MKIVASFASLPLCFCLASQKKYAERSKTEELTITKFLH